MLWMLAVMLVALWLPQFSGSHTTKEGLVLILLVIAVIATLAKITQGWKTL
jgi:tryptophan-rich sensory protein